MKKQYIPIEPEQWELDAEASYAFLKVLDFVSDKPRLSKISLEDSEESEDVCTN